MLNKYQLAWNSQQAGNYVFDRYEFIANPKPDPEQILIRKDLFIKNLSKDAAIVIDISINTPMEVLSNKDNRGLTWHKIAVYLQKHRGWTYTRTTKVRKEIKKFLKEN